MGSSPTLDQQPGSRWGRDAAPDRYALASRAELLDHLQTPAAAGGHEFGGWPAWHIANGFGDLAARHRHDHTRLTDEFLHAHPAPTPTLRRAEAEQAFDRLNPEFGVPADQADPAGHRAAQQREAALALGTRVAVAASRENDPTPVLAIAGQDYRAADAARQQQARARRDPARAGAER